jgi:nucleoside-diphosphate-sugar epimerase
MWRQILVTGATGALGPPLIRELLRRDCAERIGLLIRPGAYGAEKRFRDLVGDLDEACLPVGALFPVAGDLSEEWDPDAALSRDTEVIVHAAADTSFRAAPWLQERINVDGTRAILNWARRCPRLSHLVLVSTTCVAGARSGSITETATPAPPQFVNPYERTKWQAERITLESGLSVRVVRLSTCAGDEGDGTVARLGALHHSLQWLYRGLVPMVPGSVSTPVDFISTNLAVAVLTRAAMIPLSGTEIVHVAAGIRAAPLAELLTFLIKLFAETHAGWRRGQIIRPMIVDGAAFAAFRRSVELSRDLLLRQVTEATESFLPSLLYPKTFETKNAEQFWGGPLPLPDWRQTIARVMQFCLRTNWGRSLQGACRYAG